MGIEVDIKEVVEEVGTEFEIIRLAGVISGEYLTTESNSQITKPFIREFFLDASMPYDTEVVAGDIIRFPIDNRKFIVMNKTPEHFENIVVEQSVVLYKCNVSGEIQRFSGETSWDSNYQMSGSWTTILGSGEEPRVCYGLLTEKLFGTELLEKSDLGQIGIQADELYLPHSYGAEPLDRYVVASGEYLKIKTVEKRKYDNVDICSMEEDTR